MRASILKEQEGTRSGAGLLGPVSRALQVGAEPSQAWTCSPAGRMGVGAGHSSEGLVSMVAPCIRAPLVWFCAHTVPPQCWGLGHPPAGGLLSPGARRESRLKLEVSGDYGSALPSPRTSLGDSLLHASSDHLLKQLRAAGFPVPLGSSPLSVRLFYSFVGRTSAHLGAKSRHDAWIPLLREGLEARPSPPPGREL